MSPLPDPAAASPRTDLPFLARRSARRPSGTSDAAVSAFIRGEGGHGAHHGAPSTPSLELSAPGPAPSASLDLSAPPSAAPAPPPSAAPSAPAPSASLDLAPPGAAPAAASSSSLDLSDPPAPVRAEPTPPPVAARAHSRITGREQRLLGVRDPTVWLTRVQSGVGELRVDAVCSTEVGDLRLGAAYQFASGATSVTQFAGGNRFAPSSRRPVIVCGHDDYEHLRLDLRQNREIERVTIYAFSESRAVLTWGGTLVVETFADAHIELPLESLRPGRVAVLLSIYNVDGELVVRTEMETVDGDVREAARAYGYDRITWRDARTPVD